MKVYNVAVLFATIIISKYPEKENYAVIVMH